MQAEQLPLTDFDLDEFIDLLKAKIEDDSLEDAEPEVFMVNHTLSAIHSRSGLVF